MNLEIPLKIYRYIIVLTIFIVLGIGGYLYFKMNFDKVKKAILIWYIVILEINLIHLYYIFHFYDKNKLKIGKKGPTGIQGPRGFKGKSQICSACGLAGQKNIIYAGNINDNGIKIEQANNSKITSSESKCVFPFIYNYEYQYKPIKTSPPGQDTNDAHIFGWCATEIEDDFTVKKYGYVNQNNSIQKRLQAEKKYRKNMKNYMENNRGILDIDIVYGNNEYEALQKCDQKPGFKVYPQDLNSGVEGKFIYLCYREGYGNKGISKLLAYTHSDPRTKPEQRITINDSNETYELINVNLNEGSTIAKTNIYLYKLFSDTGFIKKLALFENLSPTTEAITEKNLEYLNGYNKDDNKITPITSPSNAINLNDGGPSSTSINLYYTKKKSNILFIDTAFVYKNGYLYIFRGNIFFKMDKIPKQQSISVQSGYPKNLSVMWGKSPNQNKNSVENCSEISNENECNSASNCSYDDTNNMCEDIANYDAAFTYGYNNKTYLFKGSNVYLYDDTKRKIALGYPKKISEVFEGVPSNINAVFTWGKDKKTYFFKGPLYYKYDDKNKKVEYGYPRKTSTRWKNIPLLFDAIFTLKNTLDNDSDNNPTYIISGDMSYYIDPISDIVKNKKYLDDRFNGFLPKMPVTTQITTST